MSEPRPNTEFSETAKIPASNKSLDLFPLGDSQYDSKYDDDPFPEVPMVDTQERRLETLALGVLQSSKEYLVVRLDSIPPTPTGEELRNQYGPLEPHQIAILQEIHTNALKFLQ